MLRCHTEGAARHSAASKLAKQPTATFFPAPKIIGLDRQWCVVPTPSEHPHFRRIMSHSVIAKLSRHGSTHAFDCSSRKIAA
jgi:hypothetical protein